jgi:hypothetical protein
LSEFAIETVEPEFQADVRTVARFLKSGSLVIHRLHESERGTLTFSGVLPTVDNGDAKLGGYLSLWAPIYALGVDAEIHRSVRVAFP